MTETRSSGRMHPGVALVLAVFGAAVLIMSARGCLLSPPWHDWNVFWNFGALGGSGLFGIWGLIQIGLAIWVGMDASARGSNGWLWGLLVFFTPVVGLVVYLILVSGCVHGNGAGFFPRGLRDCPSCGKPVRSDFKLCPYCGQSHTCTGCGKPLEAEWKVCPFCGGAAGGAQPQAGVPPAAPEGS